MHLYIVVDCQTPDCKATHTLMHLGEKGKIPVEVEVWTPYPLMIECQVCRQIHDYSELEGKFRQIESPHPPPAGYSNKLAAPWNQKRPPAN